MSDEKRTRAMADNPPVFYSISWVPAPKCEACGKGMMPHSSTEWACETNMCSLQAVPFHTGVYPFHPIKDT